MKIEIPFTIALTEKGKDEFSKIFVIDKGKILSYPYAIESEGKLYVAYSSSIKGRNQNSAELAVIDLEDLT